MIEIIDEVQAHDFLYVGLQVIFNLSFIYRLERISRLKILRANRQLWMSCTT